MHRRRCVRFVLPLVLLLTSVAGQAIAEVRLPSVIGDNMVLQRGERVRVWGWDEPGTTVSVTIAKQAARAKAGPKGSWSVRLPSLKAGGPYELVVAGSSTRTLKNVLVGEVWLCSGQSNMEWRVRQSNNAQAEIAAAKYPLIRHIKIQRRPAASPQSDVPSGGWKVCGPKTAGDFSAAGYFFARHLHKELGVPIGLLGCNWGGTRIEPWITPEGFEAVPQLNDIATRFTSLPGRLNNGQVDHQAPLALHNGMVAPLMPYAIRGALWYQGESNNGEGLRYLHKMKALIAGWRQAWDKPRLPFYFVQLAPYRYGRADPLNLPGIWDAQRRTLSVPHTGMAVTVDIGNTSDIHPKNKQDVGKRLALWALAKTYGKKGLVYSGPLYKSMKVKRRSIRLDFDHVGDGLVSRDGKRLTDFLIAGEDRAFHAADAVIDGDRVVVSSRKIRRPVAVRFGWHQEAEPNLSNKNGLPASPFRTDSW